MPVNFLGILQKERPDYKKLIRTIILCGFFSLFLTGLFFVFSASAMAENWYCDSRHGCISETSDNLDMRYVTAGPMTVQQCAATCHPIEKYKCDVGFGDLYGDACVKDNEEGTMTSSECHQTCKSPHYVCDDTECSTKQGFGINECYSNQYGKKGSCAKYGCQDGRCVLVAAGEALTESVVNVECDEKAPAGEFLSCSYYGCEGTSCSLIPHKGINSCGIIEGGLLMRQVAPGPEEGSCAHYECEALKCVAKAGKGENACKQNIDPGPAEGSCSHYECEGVECVLKPGKGENKCDINNAVGGVPGSCRPEGWTKPYKKCDNGKCLEIQDWGITNCIQGVGYGEIGSCGHYACSANKCQCETILTSVPTTLEQIFNPECTKEAQPGDKYSCVPAGKTCPYYKCGIKRCTKIQDIGVSDCIESAKINELGSCSHYVCNGLKCEESYQSIPTTLEQWLFPECWDGPNVKPGSEYSCIKTCETIEYWDWGPCQPDNKQWREVKRKLPGGCVGGPPEILWRDCPAPCNPETDCNGHATSCNIDGVCNCDQDYTGDHCETLRVGNCDHLGGCNKHGFCTLASTCTCDPDWAGPDCADCIPTMAGQDCGILCQVCANGGTCKSGITGDGTCACTQGWDPKTNCKTSLGEGVCGTANGKIYPAGTSEIPASALCTHGTPIPSRVVFSGNTVSWNCASTVYISTTECSASRQASSGSCAGICGHGTCKQGKCNCNGVMSINIFNGYIGSILNSYLSQISNKLFAVAGCVCTECECYNNSTNGHWTGATCSTCASGWTGATCNTPVTCTPGCSSNWTWTPVPCQAGTTQSGTCTSTNCGTAQTLRDTRDCPSSTCSPACEHGGTCLSNGTCDCSTATEAGVLYSGAFCTVPILGNCSGGCWYGFCNPITNICECYEGWKGANCNEPVTTACTSFIITWSPSTCPANGIQSGTVTGKEPAGCTGQYSGSLTRTCVPGTTIDNCTPNPCQNSGVCSPTSTSFTCDCAGTGHTGATCTTPESTSGSCGTATSGSYNSPGPTTNLCASGTATTPEYYSGLWEWKCGDKDCHAGYTESLCGTANHGVFAVAPAGSALCVAGVTSGGVSYVSSVWQWEWDCGNGTIPENNCSALRPPACGSDNGIYPNNELIPGYPTNLCSVGKPSTPAGTNPGPWTWTCRTWDSYHYTGNSPPNNIEPPLAQCATVAGTCGAAEGGYYSSPGPTVNLCYESTPSAVTPSGNLWVWTCSGKSCSAHKVEACSPDPCNGHGTCNSTTGVCTCNPGWKGDEYCSTQSCELKNNCSPGGYCSGPNTCTCYNAESWSLSSNCSACSADWYPKTASDPTLMCMQKCNSTLCYGHGTCNADGSCNCEPDWNVYAECSAKKCWACWRGASSCTRDVWTENGQSSCAFYGFYETQSDCQSATGCQ